MLPSVKFTLHRHDLKLFIGVGTGGPGAMPPPPDFCLFFVIFCFLLILVLCRGGGLCFPSPCRFFRGQIWYGYSYIFLHIMYKNLTQGRLRSGHEVTLSDLASKKLEVTSPRKRLRPGHRSKANVTKLSGLHKVELPTTCISRIF